MTFPDRDPQVFFDLARDQLAGQLEALDALDSKIGLLFSTATTLVGILAAVLALRPGRFGVVEYTAAFLTLVVYAVVCWQTERAYRARDWKAGPNLKQLYRLYKDSSEDDRWFKWQMANQLRLDYESNKGQQVFKSDALQVILPWVMTQSAILVLTLFLVAVGA